jgi:hypothetical protein
MRKLMMLLIGGAFLALFALGTTGCMDAPQSTQQAHNDVNQRYATFSRAEAADPVPNITTFPRRQTLVEATKRQSLENHPWYVYVLGQNGNIVNYFVAKTVPVNDCDYLSSTDNITNGTGSNTGDNNVVIRSPSLEGIYQSSSGCNTLTFFDLATNAEIQVSSLQTFVTDRPLKVDAQAVKIKGSK